MNPRTLLLRTLLGAAIAASATLTPACSESDDSDADAAQSELEAPGGRWGPAMFRNDFYTYLKDEGYTADQARELVFVPTEAAIKPKVSANDDSPLKPYDDAYSRLRPMDFYQQGLLTALHYKIGPNGPLENELRRNPVHIVIIPGIFGEFIPVSPFEEVFQHGGAASVTWDRKITELLADKANDGITHDKQFNAAALKDVDRSMKDLLRVGSIDAQDGTPLVTITYLKPELGSLESFRTLDENADYYLPRLDKYFKAMGIPEHLYVMGYSRGTPVALNLVSRATSEKRTWAPKIKGVITLAGVIYGSQLADEALKDGSAQRKLIDRLSQFSVDLESCSGPDWTYWQRAKNAVHWASFLSDEAKLAANLGNRNAELKREGIETAGADSANMVAFTERVLLGDPQKIFSADASDVSSLGVLHLRDWNTEYCQNVDRLKVTAKHVIAGIKTLSTEARLDWFRTHTLPTNVRYFSITGSMGDATEQNTQPTVLVENPKAYDIHSLDFRSLRTNYYDMRAATGNQLQDSQVTVARAHFWPEIHSTLNPNQGTLDTYFMGTVGVHHWGLSFPRAFSTKDGAEANPFPRSTFLKSLATFVAQVESRNGKSTE